MVVIVKEILEESKQTLHTFDVEIFNLRNIRELEVMKQYQIDNCNRFAALENYKDGGKISGAGENIKWNVRLSCRVQFCMK